ncbi:MAG: helix-turn-helix transcriptional regulator [Nitrososphaerota archaeon]|jgi:DNA-binding HxlR family transcriptional regulator|nr:helix-turn-helix transcriptional regulator [Nitrososphaerota archaeon]MDG6980590.1 helix-turn-helix transcriptional regulator [Nitrososphaerota archaeon]MDG6983676.1 helix-turn-helix transcriptional regulator [Nitrososphaerota archaeon]
MPQESKLIDTCPIQGVIDVVSKKWALLIICVLGNAPKMRYNEIMNELRGISPKTLADTLKQLSSSGIINRRAVNEIPPRVEYSLTEDGEKLRDAIIPVIEWAVDRSSHRDCIILQSVLAKKRP